MKKIYIIASLFFILFSTGAYSQRIWTSQLDQYAFNPAGAGMHDIGSVSTAFYNTYGNANNNPFGFLLMGTTPFPNDKIAAGFRMTTESAGVLNTTMGEATFAYRFPVFKNSRLAFGVSAVINQLSLLRDRMNPQHPDDPIINGARSGFWGDANFGTTLYQANKYYFGIGVYNLIGGSTDLRVDDFTNRAGRLYSLSGMYTFNIAKGDGRLEFTGNALSYFSKGSSELNYAINARCIVKKSFWFGGGYSPETVKFLFGLYFQNFAVGYTGGIGMGEIKDHTYTLPKHEIMLKIDFNNSKTSRALLSK